ncbi:MAG TPA: glycoside hydrolase family 1 protein [Pyrinomonadaceae bacterium]|nr:glycoside hydrolase family 1 protein [Pyrinomonadaceae bacterium]
MKKLFKITIFLLLIVAVLYVAEVFYLHFSYPQTRWDWSKIDTNDVSFPKDFYWGTATAAHQIEGNNENTNWGEWEKDSSRIKDKSNAKIAVDGWNRWREDVKLMKDLGVNSYRFSLAWNKIEPEKGKINEDALKHYDEFINDLKANNIEPMITLHHFTHPLWFEQLGAFEKEENIKHFVEFSRIVFVRYRDRVNLWVTLNEPNVFVTSGYFNTAFPPGKPNPKLAAEVLKNMLKAHVEVYKALKTPLQQRPPIEERWKIGLATSIFQFEPARRWHLGDWAIARISSNTFNEGVLGFFRDGRMKFHVPFEVDLTYEDANAPNTLDFIGVNYYSHYAFRFDFDFKKATQSLPVEGEAMTDMPYTIYTEGIYRAIKDVSALKKPIIITENGISDAKDDRREKYIKQSLYAVSKAIKDGYDVRGYFYWTLLDNFEWAEGYTQKFGLYEVNLETQERKLRNGSKAFVEIIGKSK